MNCYKQFSLLIVIAFAAFELNCGGGPQNPQASGSPSTASASSSPGATAPSSTAGTGSSGTSGSGSGSSGNSSNSGGTSGSGSSSGSATSASSNSSNSTGTTFSNLHQKGGWTGYGLLPASYSICSSCDPNGPKVTWSMQQGVNDPSQSGNSTKFSIGGKMQYSDALWNNHLIGDFSSRGKPDSDHKIVPSVHNFTYDVYFFLKDLGKSQAVEFDINQFVNGKSFIWGHECRIAGGNEWDIWDNPGQKWHPTGVKCHPKNNDWNHLVIQAQRTDDDKVLFQSITLNGQTATLNYKEDPTPTKWYGITINYQQDGNYAQQSYSVWLDKLNFTYW